MNTMQKFYAQLSATNPQRSQYQATLHKLTQLRREQLNALRSLLWWNVWSENSKQVLG